MKRNAGFTLIELLLSMTIFVLLLGLTTISLSRVQTQASLNSVVDTLIADLSQQQIKAMVGDAEARANVDNYGIYFDTTQYILFHGAYSITEPSNFSITLPTIFQVTTDFPNSEVVFLKGSGAIAGFTGTEHTITVQNITLNEQKIIRMNRYGVITGVN